ncbi:Uncharacterised protein [Legionella wadsworthii]|uniref:Uncharacterized protein n=1 Tax=Legionella wadsworthii TaxID=28088 RepID=A0A378LR41_9GAMM|nr:hypothetical protein [Legionella wadsworthii]STY29263.1 Uncharacterised protein [Legionella wadsworthii]
MNPFLLISIGLLVFNQAFSLNDPLKSFDENKTLLPSPYPVYTMENNGVMNHPFPGGVSSFLPTDNSYTLSPGCYIACYSHHQGIYSVAQDIYVMGQIRVPGQYQARICQPSGFKGMDISRMSQFKLLCSEKIDTCKNNQCWAGGDTGGWFGIQ